MATQRRGHAARCIPPAVQGTLVGKTTAHEVPAAVEPTAEEQNNTPEIDADELMEWLESLDDIAYRYSPQELQQLLHALTERAAKHGASLPFQPTTPYVNTIPVSRQPK